MARAITPLERDLLQSAVHCLKAHTDCGPHRLERLLHAQELTDQDLMDIVSDIDACTHRMTLNIMLDQGCTMQDYETALDALTPLRRYAMHQLIGFTPPSGKAQDYVMNVYA